MANDGANIGKLLDVYAIGKHHNELLGRLLDRQKDLSTADDIVEEALRYVAEVDRAPEIVRELFGVSLRSLIATRTLGRPLHELGLTRNLTSYLQGYVMTARPGRARKRSVRQTRSRTPLTGFDRLAFDVFAEVFTSSAQFWFDHLSDDKNEEPEPSYMVIPTGSHTGIDVGKLATADASGAVGALAGAGALGLLGVTTVSGPLSPAGLAGYLAVAGGIASFLFYLGGGADVIFEREPLVPAPGPDDGGEQPIS